MSKYFPPYNSSSKNIKVELDLSNYVTKDDKTDLLKLEDRIKENEKEASFNGGFFYYKGQGDSVYECKAKSFNYGNIYITAWKPADILNYPATNHVNAFTNSKIKLSSLISNIKPRVYLEGNYFKQSRAKTSNVNIINIYCVYELKDIANSRNNEFTIQNGLFGVIKITKNTDTSKNKYEGYGICFDGSKTFAHTQKESNSSYSTLARIVIIFGADMSFNKHANNKANNIYVMSKEHIQKINDTTIYAEKMFHRNFTKPEKNICIKFAL